MFFVDVGKVPFASFESFLELVAVFHNAAFNHFAQQVVAFAGTFAHAGEHGESVVTFGNIVDQLHDEHGLANAGTSEEADFAALAVGFEKVDYLDACGEDFGAYGEVVEIRRGLVDRTQVVAVKLGQLVDSLADDVEKTSFDLLACGHRYGAVEVLYFESSAQSVGTFHCNATGGILAYVLLYFENQVGAVGAFYFQSCVNRGYDVAFAFENNVYYRSDYLCNLACLVAH